MSVIYRPRHEPYIPKEPSPALIQTSTDENDLPAIFANKQKFMSPIIFARPTIRLAYSFPGGMGPIPPVGSGNGMRPGRGRSPATRRYLFRPSPSGNPPRTPYRSAVTR